MSRWISLLCLALLSWAAAAQAQVSITGSIAGTVMDTSDAVLPGAAVNLRDESTGIEKSTVTNTTGAFAFRDLNLGSYQITVNLSGFRSALYNKVIVEAGRTTDLRIKLDSARRTDRQRRSHDAGPRSIVERHLEHADQQGCQ